MTDAKFKLEDILNKQKAPPQILDLVHIKIETEEDYKGVIENSYICSKLTILPQNSS